MKVHHFGIEVSNLEESISFYINILNLEVGSKFQFMDEEIVFLSGNGLLIELIKRNLPTMKLTSTHLALEIENLEEMISHFKSKGLVPVEGPYQLSNGGKLCFMKALMERYWNS
ncbi:VOC family protein [Heyndrickxia sp. FSL K6-6286]|uniref:VOC family protein n=1 Tax=Heyndrickxia sp. FSL K6-6286 TaxID=2921510 RepID=UPI00315AA030